MSHLGTHFAHLLKFSSVDDDSDVISFDTLCQRLLSSIENIDFSVVDADGTDSVRGYGAKHIRKVMDFCRTHSMPAGVSSHGVVSGSFSPFNPSDFPASALANPLHLSLLIMVVVLPIKLLMPISIQMIGLIMFIVLTSLGIIYLLLLLIFMFVVLLI